LKPFRGFPPITNVRKLVIAPSCGGRRHSRLFCKSSVTRDSLPHKVVALQTFHTPGISKAQHLWTFTEAASQMAGHAELEIPAPAAMRSSTLRECCAAEVCAFGE